MKTLHNYLTRQVLASLLMAVAVFAFVLLLGNVLKEILVLLVSGQARFGIVAEAIGLLIPFVLVFALPMGLLTATLLVFGRISADQELTAARAGGVSLLSLISPVLLLSLLCCGVSAGISMELGPQCHAAYSNLVSRLRGELVNLQLPAGQFIHNFPGYIFYTEKNNKGKLENVIVLKLENETNTTMTITAPRGNIELDATNKEMFLHLVQPRIIDRRGMIMSAGDWVSDNLYPTNTAAGRISKPSIRDMTFWQLRDELRGLELQLALTPPAMTNWDETPAQLREAAKQRENLTEPIRFEMNRQVAYSFACFGFTLVGIPLGIRVHRRETNIGVAIALGLVLVYYSFVILGESLSARPEFAPHLIVWLPDLVFQAAGAVLLWRANRGI